MIGISGECSYVHRGQNHWSFQRVLGSGRKGSLFRLHVGLQNIQKRCCRACGKGNDLDGMYNRIHFRFETRGYDRRLITMGVGPTNNVRTKIPRPILVILNRINVSEWGVDHETKYVPGS